MEISTKTKRRAKAAREKIRKMVEEITQWKGAPPTLVRVTLADYLALVDVGWIKDGKLSGGTLEVKVG